MCICTCALFRFLRRRMLDRRNRYFPGNRVIGFGMLAAARATRPDTFLYQLQDGGVGDELIQLQALPWFRPFKKSDGSLIVETDAQCAINDQYRPQGSLEHF